MCQDPGVGPLETWPRQARWTLSPVPTATGPLLAAQRLLAQPLVLTHLQVQYISALKASWCYAIWVVCHDHVHIIYNCICSRNPPYDEPSPMVKP